MLHSSPSDTHAWSQSSRSLFLFHWYHLFSLKQHRVESPSWGFNFLWLKWRRRCLPCLLILKLKRKLRLLMLGHCSFQVNSLLFKFDKKFYIISKYFYQKYTSVKNVSMPWGENARVSELFFKTWKPDLQHGVLCSWAICAPVVVCLP